ncbi:purine nucleoside phosphorylase LACC1-like [Physella acuta]|uniref:purine nucleoside phosphorylase LACC1-like n=1 Tax=Physella acuta TaxID=109671 RepID=UPI0027DC6F42|nr:purine nucleoside phosphorylase LACC1-like [Physella acuta]
MVYLFYISYELGEGTHQSQLQVADTGQNTPSTDLDPMSHHGELVLDLATDPCQTTRDQLMTVAQNQLTNSRLGLTVLTRTLDASTLPDCRLIRSDDNLDLLFKAKTCLDEAGVSDFVLMTSLAMKKFWETACLHVFSHVHTWQVTGVDVQSQLPAVEPWELEQVETGFKEYLKGVGRQEQVQVLRSHVIPADRFNAGFHERFGGVSQLSPLTSLNMLYTIRKPDPVLVIEENRRRLAEAAGFEPASLRVAKVEHDKNIWVVGKPPPPKFDGVVTNIPGVTVAAPGADCAMILLADTKTGACGAVHAGWRGTTVGAVRACLQTMVEEFGTDPQDIRAAIGPTIEGKCFDLPASDAAPLTRLDPGLVWGSARHPDWVHADLVQANVLMLQLDGVPAGNIDTSCALCTVCNKQFFSHRRDNIPFGNQIGFISCRKSGGDNL